MWRRQKVRQWVEGTPTLLIRKGKVLKENLDKEKIVQEELEQALREHGVASVEEVNLAVLEIDGSISVLRNDEVPSADRPHRHIRFLRRKT